MSNAKEKFDSSIREIDDLVAIHLILTGGAVGRPTEKAAVVNKSGVVLVCAFWQAYCEDVLFEALEKIAKKKSDGAPKGLQQIIGRQVIGKAAAPKYEGPWKLAGNGWRNEVRGLIKRLSGDKERPLDTPNSDNVQARFADYLSVDDITSGWYWQGMSRVQARRRLDDFIRVRHRVAHRGADLRSIRKKTVTDFQGLVVRLVEKMDSALGSRGMV